MKLRDAYATWRQGDTDKAYEKMRGAVEIFSKSYTGVGDNVEAAFKYVDAVKKPEPVSGRSERASQILEQMGQGVGVGTNFVPGAEDASKALLSTRAVNDAVRGYQEFSSIAGRDPAQAALDQEVRRYLDNASMLQQLERRNALESGPLRAAQP